MVNSKIMNSLIWYKCKHYMNAFGRHLCEKFGSGEITQYIHAMIAGHFSQFINRKPNEYLNIFDHNQIGLIYNTFYYLKFFSPQFLCIINSKDLNIVSKKSERI